MKEVKTGQDELRLNFGKDDEESRSRLRELILFIADQCKDDPKFGATKLNKLLYYSDFIAFREFGEPLTGAKYMRLPNGPVPVHLVPLREQMLESGEIELQTTKHYTYEQTRIVALRDAALDGFSGRDIKLITGIIAELSECNAADVSGMSHGRAWNAASNKEVIPYEAALISDADLNQGDLDWANKILNTEYAQ